MEKIIQIPKQGSGFFLGFDRQSSLQFYSSVLADPLQGSLLRTASKKQARAEARAPAALRLGTEEAEALKAPRPPRALDRASILATMTYASGSIVRRSKALQKKLIRAVLLSFDDKLPMQVRHNTDLALS